MVGMVGMVGQARANPKLNEYNLWQDKDEDVGGCRYLVMLVYLIMFGRYIYHLITENKLY